jgi:hypothetical protein
MATVEVFDYRLPIVAKQRLGKYPPTLATQRLGKNVTVATYMHVTIEGLLDASFMRGP